MRPNIDLQDKLAIIDLTSNSYTKRRADRKIIRGFLGGRGLGVFLLNRFHKPDIEPFSPDNPLIISPGLLTGSGVICAARMNITARSPETGYLGDSNIGGYFGAKLRGLGYLAAIILGKAPKPSILAIEKDKVELVPMPELWGSDTVDAQLALRQQLGKGAEILVIGRAGENLCRFAAIISDIKNAAGRCGLGAVMGSKNIKAIVAMGDTAFKVANPRMLMERNLELIDYIKGSLTYRQFSKYGTAMLFDASNALGAIRTNNSMLNQTSDDLSCQNFKQLSEKMLPCYGCFVHCRHRNKLGGEGPEYSSLGLLGANCGITDPKKVVALNNKCNRLGLDTSSAGSIIAWSIELSQKGLLGEYQPEHPFEFGDYELVNRMLDDIAMRRGIGDLLADGSSAGKRLPQGASDYLIAVKGLPQSDPHDVRYMKSFALGIGVSSRGADHLRNRPTLDMVNLPEGVKKRFYGKKVSMSPTEYVDKAYMVYFHENLYAVVDALGICKFICHGFNSPQFLDYSHFSQLIKLVVGIDFTVDNLKEIAHNILDLERQYNLQAGMKKAEDTLPRRYFTEPAPLGAAANERIDEQAFQRMVGEYYSHRGWDENGIPAPRTIKGLLDIDL